MSQGTSRGFQAAARPRSARQSPGSERERRHREEVPPDFPVGATPRSRLGILDMSPGSLLGEVAPSSSFVVSSRRCSLARGASKIGWHLLQLPTPDSAITTSAHPTSPSR